MDLNILCKFFFILLAPGYVFAQECYELPPSGNCSEVKFWVTIPGMELFGGQRTIVNNVDLEDCKRICEQEGDSCKSFDLIVGENSCELYSKADGDPGTSMEPAPDKIHYYKEDLCKGKMTSPTVPGNTTMPHDDDDDNNDDDDNGDDDDDDDKSQFMRWVEDDPEYIVLVGMFIFIIFLFVVIIGLIIYFTQKNKNEFNVMSTKI